MQARVGLPAKIVVGMQQNLEKAREVFLAEKFGGLFQSRTLVRGRGNQLGIRSADARDEQVAEMADRFAAEMLQVLSVREQSVHEREYALG